MCGRYAASADPDALVEEFEVEVEVVPRPLEPDYNVAPTKDAYAVLTRRSREMAEDAPPARQLRILRWGLVPSWAKDPSIGSRMINARMETVADKPAFRRAFAKRRCLVPADGYYEWYTPDGTSDSPGTAGKATSGRVPKQPFFIHPSDGGVLAMAGIYEFWRAPDAGHDDPTAWWWTFALLTTEAEDSLGRIHDRMPLLVERDRYAEWLDPELDDPDALRALLVPAAPGRLEAYPVSTEVNNHRNNGPELVEPLPAEQATVAAAVLHS